jgi:lipid-A-disaccharide synthase
MYPEFIQDAARADVLAKQLQACLHDPARIAATAADAAELRSRLLPQASSGTAPLTVADWLLARL